MMSRAHRWVIGCISGVLLIGGGQAASAGHGSMIDAAALQLKFSHANEAYRQGRYDEAIPAYHAILDLGVESGPLYYNVGNAFLKSGRTSEALWAYLKAKTLMPRDPDLAANLSYAKSLHPNVDGVSLSIPPLIRWLTIGTIFSLDELSTALLLLLWAAAIAWALVGWAPRARALTRPVAWCVSLATTVVLAALVVQTVCVDGVPKAVTVGKGVEVKFAPQESGTLHFTLPQGAVVRVLGREFGWVQVARADGKSGWVKENALKRL